MPGFNQQGPRNQGPMTGRGLGVCANGPMADSPNFGGGQFRGQGLGFRRGRGSESGRGRGSEFGRGPGPFCGRGYSQSPMAGGVPGTFNAGSVEDLTLRAEILESELKAIKNALTALSKPSDTPS